MIKQPNSSLIDFHHLSDLNLSGGDVRESTGGGSGDHEGSLQGRKKEEVHRYEGYLTGMGCL